MNAPVELRRRKLSIEQFQRMGEAGILREDERVELIRGELIEMAPIGSRHMGLVTRLMRMLVHAVANDAVVSTQNPVVLPPDTEPQPDITVLKPRADDYQESLPTATDVLLMIEVADTSLRYDRDVKLPIYAEYGIPELWLFDVQARAVSIYRDPAVQGYQRQLTPGKNEKISPARLPHVQIDLAEVWR